LFLKDAIITCLNGKRSTSSLLYLKLVMEWFNVWCFYMFSYPQLINKPTKKERITKSVESNVDM